MRLVANQCRAIPTSTTAAPKLPPANASLRRIKNPSSGIEDLGATRNEPRVVKAYAATMNANQWAPFVTSVMALG
jgi:hypothetical protein